MEAERTTISYEEVKALLEEHFARFLELRTNDLNFQELTQLNQSICLTILTLLSLDEKIKERKGETKY